MKTIILKCEICSKEFERPLGEHKRNQKLNRKSFCSRSCAGKRIGQTNFIKEYWGKYNSNLRVGSERDIFSPFRQFIRSIKSRNFDHDISVEYLKELWEKQGGLCPYTGFQMILKRKRGLYQASLDRIDPSKGYVKGNVEFVCLVVNYAKNGFSKEDLSEFFNKIRNQKIV